MLAKVFASFVVGWLFVLFAATAEVPGPREPLTFQNVGLYGGWNEYFVSKDSPFDFYIVQAVVVDGKILGAGQAADGTVRSWDEWLKLARANGKRVIADLGASITVNGTEHSFQGSWNEKDPIPVEQFFPMFDKFFDEVDEGDIYAFTIGEENVFWNGQQERLVAAYNYLKNKYHVPLWQWWSPSHGGSTVGMSWPNLPADGWALDEYFMQQPAMEAAMRMYAVMQKPAFQTIWAAPEYPGWNWSEKLFWEQYSVCRKYNIPVAFFCWTGRSDSPYSSTWAWQKEASPRMRQTFEDYCVHAAKLAKRLPPVPVREWDFVPWAPPRIQLKLDESGKSAGYEDTFVKPRQIASWSDATFTGFANLCWDSTPLQLKPRSSGTAVSTLRYCFESPAKIARITAKIEGSVSQGSGVEAKLMDMQDRILTGSAMKDGVTAIDFDATQFSQRQFVLVVSLKGQAVTASDVLAEVSKVSISCELVK